MTTEIVVVGMGYVGIPCAVLLANVAGHNVTGIQRRSPRSGSSPTSGWTAGGRGASSSGSPADRGHDGRRLHRHPRL